MECDEYKKLIDERDADTIVAAGGVPPQEARIFRWAFWTSWLCFILGWGLFPNLYFIFFPGGVETLLDSAEHIPNRWMHQFIVFALPFGLGSFCSAATFSYIYKKSTKFQALTWVFLVQILAVVTSFTLQPPPPLWLSIVTVLLPIPSGLLAFRMVRKSDE